MLPLDDERWKTFEPPAWRPHSLASLVREWLLSIGQPDEMDRYDDFSDAIMHQGDVASGAYALVPYLVEVCREGRTPFVADYLTVVGLIERDRLAHRSPDVPEYLLQDYVRAVQVAAELVPLVIARLGCSARTWGLRSVRPAFQGDWELAMKYWTGEMPVPDE